MRDWRIEENEDMCGIVGIHGPRSAVSRPALVAATQALIHRGPDSQHQWIDQDQATGLGHARLSIIDLTTGDQPLANEDSSIHLVVNGEFYDFERIRTQLEQQGHRFRTHSDSEIALHLYESYGLDFIHHLRGEFAFILWDAGTRRLIAGRDRFGIKPLFYAQSAGSLYLASEVKALFAAGVPARWNSDTFYHLLSGRLVTDHSLFDGIEQVPPGHLLVMREEEIQLVRYWDFDYPSKEQRDFLSDDEHIERFRQTFEEAVRLRL